MSDSPPGISAAPKDDNLRHFDVSVSGPGQSPYEGVWQLPNSRTFCTWGIADISRWYLQAGALFA